MYYRKKGVKHPKKGAGTYVSASFAFYFDIKKGEAYGVKNTAL